jgi:hypothetical protein
MIARVTTTRSCRKKSPRMTCTSRLATS